MKCNWNIYKLFDRVDILRRLKSSGFNEKLNREIDVLEKELSDYFDKPEPTLSLLERYHIVKDTLLYNLYLWGDFNDFEEASKGIENSLIPKPKKVSLSQEDILTITHDFYKSLNHYFFGNFMKNFRHRKEQLSFYIPDTEHEQSFGYCFFLPYSNCSFIAVSRNYTLEDVLTVIHEYAHALSFKANYKSSYSYIFCEIISLFMELVACDYLQKYFNNGDITFIKAKNFYCNYKEAYYLNRLIEITEDENEDYHEDYTKNKELRYAARKKNILDDELDEILAHPEEIAIEYVGSSLFALELYKKYLQDKEKALLMLQNIINFKYEDDLNTYFNLKSLGLHPNLSTKEYQKELKLELEKWQK